MTYKFDFSGDYGYELSTYDINAINSLEGIDEKAQYCNEILDRENGYKKIVKRWGVDVIQFCSENGYLILSVYCVTE